MLGEEGVVWAAGVSEIEEDASGSIVDTRGGEEISAGRVVSTVDPAALPLSVVVASVIEPTTGIGE